MPELPEIETLACQLQKKISGRVLSQLLIQNDDILETPRQTLEKKLPGRKVIRVGRRGKFLCLDLEGGLTLWLHLGMTGQLFWALHAKTSDPHFHFAMHFMGLPQPLIFRDVRRFGALCLTNGGVESLPKGIRSLGPDPFEIPEETFVALLKGRKGRIKNLLLNQRLLSGLGNIYADESLHRARIDPRRRPYRLRRTVLAGLHGAIRETLGEAIRKGGSSIDDYLHADGGRGSFQNFHRVYGRGGEPCLHCGFPIQKIYLAGRGSHFCPNCQK